MNVANPLACDLDHVLARTSMNVWEELRGSRIFITGGTGFFGRWLQESLAWANDRLNLGASAVVLSRDPSRFAVKAPHLADRDDINFLTGDVRSFSFPEGNFTHVIHAATEVTVTLNSEQPLVMLDTIVEGTRRTLDFAVRSRAKRFLLTSSGAVYGRQPPDLSRLPETFLGGPDTTDSNAAYGEGKRIAEYLSCTYARAHGLEAVIARCFAIVGPHLRLNAHYAVGNFIRDAIAGAPIRIKGNGLPIRSYLYAADMTAWLWTLLVNGQTCRAYNLGSDQTTTIIDLARSIAALFNPSPEITVRSEMSEGAFSSDRYVPSIDRARSELGLSVWVALADALNRTTQWAQSSEAS